jgi:RNA polymerase sigma-70 factor (ECF subfamily)
MKMLYNMMPLTAEQSTFAAENHGLIEKYLNSEHFSQDDFYDVAVFGYLRAVQDYLTQPELRRRPFADVAFQAMGQDVRTSQEYRRQAVRMNAKSTPARCRILEFPQEIDAYAA